jgi:hypothetical protein
MEGTMMSAVKKSIIESGSFLLPRFSLATTTATRCMFAVLARRPALFLPHAQREKRARKKAREKEGK